MKGNPKILEVLNQLLERERDGIRQYSTHSAICDSYGYAKLVEYLDARAKDEMRHASMLKDRLLFFGSLPTAKQFDKTNIDFKVSKQFVNDHEAELGSANAYNEAIKLAEEVGDNATRKILTEILVDEDRHINDIENYQYQIYQMSEGVFLSTQTD